MGLSNQVQVAINCSRPRRPHKKENNHRFGLHPISDTNTQILKYRGQPWNPFLCATKELGRKRASSQNTD